MRACFPFIVCFLAAFYIQGCGCTAVGCADAVTLSFKALASSAELPITIQICTTDTSCSTFTVSDASTCTPEKVAAGDYCFIDTDGTVNASVGLTAPSPGDITVHAEITDGASTTILDRDVTSTLEDQRPNGALCGVACVSGGSDVTL